MLAPAPETRPEEENKSTVRSPGSNTNMDVKLEIRHLRLLAAVAEHGSITAAARQLHLTQSALSHQLKDAEDRLGARLFLRVGKKMVLTAAGSHLLTSARRTLEELSQAETHAQSLQSGPRSVIRLSTECNTSYYWLPDLWARFRCRFPGVRVSIDTASTSDPLGAMLDGKLDLALVTCPDPDNKKLVFTRVFEDETFIVLAPDHALAHVSYLTPQHFAGETVIMFPPARNSTLLNSYLLPAGVKLKEVLEISQTDLLMEMVASGMGVAWVANWAAAPHIKAGKVIARPFTKEGIRRVWYAATLRDQPDLPHLCEFINMLGQPDRAVTGSTAAGGRR
jgi:LysR family transcriptional regulator for metE and metH